MVTILEHSRKVVIHSLGLFVLLFSVVSFAGPKWKKVLSNSSGSSGGFQEFVQDGTFTVPAGVTKIQVLVIGGGGGAGYMGGGGGGGGSCVKNGSTVLASADGGDGGGGIHSTSNANMFVRNGKPGTRTTTFLTVTAGSTLNVFVGGGGGGGGDTYANYTGGGGGYGPCGSGGNGGQGYYGGAGGTGGLNKGGGGGGGGSSAIAGTASSSSSGGPGASESGASSGGLGGSSTGGGGGNGFGYGGGGSGGVGGCYRTSGTVASTSTTCSVTNANIGLVPHDVSKLPGEGGTYSASGAITGGGPGSVVISW